MKIPQTLVPKMKKCIIKNVGGSVNVVSIETNPIYEFCMEEMFIFQIFDLDPTLWIILIGIIV